MDILSRTKCIVFAVLIASFIGDAYAQVPLMKPYPEVPFRPPLRIEPYILHRHNQPIATDGDLNINYWTTTTEPNNDPILIQIRELAYNVCSPIHPITEQMISDAKNGILSDDRNFKCYLKCAFNQFGLIDSNNVIDDQTLLRLLLDHVDGIIEDIVPKCLSNDDKSKQANKDMDPCDVVYNFINCSIHVNPKAVQYIPIP